MKTKLILIVTILGLVLSNGLLFKKMQEYKFDSYMYMDNMRTYEMLDSVSRTENNALRLKLSDLRHSNDSLVVELIKTQKSLKRAENKPGDVLMISHSSIGKIDTVFIENKPDFHLDTVVSFNEKTKSYIKIDSNRLINKLDIKFNTYFSVYPRREYLNKRKNFFCRLIHFDFKRTTRVKYDYSFDNDAIKPEDVRVIVIEE